MPSVLPADSPFDPSSMYHSVLQLSSSGTGAILNIFVFHRTETFRKNYGGLLLNTHWWILWSSLSIAHVVCCSCLFTPVVLRLVMEEHFDSAKEIANLESLMMMLSIILQLFHMVSLMINDFYAQRKMKFYANAPSPENQFFMIMAWVSTVVLGIILALFGIDRRLLVTTSILFIVLSSLLVMIYTYIHYCHDRRNSGGTNYTVNTKTDRYIEQIPLNQIGRSLVMCYVTLTLPYPVEVLLWNGNGLLSYYTIILSSIIYGILSIYWLCFRLECKEDVVSIDL